MRRTAVRLLFPIAAFVVTMSLPALPAWAQVTLSGGTLTPGKIPPKALSPNFVTKSDLTDFDPVAHLLSKKKDLKLTDQQQSRLTGMLPGIKAIREAAYKRIDSLQKRDAMRLVAADNQEARRDEVAQLIDLVLVDLRTTYAGAANEALKVLTPDQLAPANALLDKLNEQ